MDDSNLRKLWSWFGEAGPCDVYQAYQTEYAGAKSVYGIRPVNSEEPERYLAVDESGNVMAVLTADDGGDLQPLVAFDDRPEFDSIRVMLSIGVWIPNFDSNNSVQYGDVIALDSVTSRSPVLEWLHAALRAAKALHGPITDSRLPASYTMEFIHKDKSVTTLNYTRLINESAPRMQIDIPCINVFDIKCLSTLVVSGFRDLWVR